MRARLDETRGRSAPLTWSQNSKTSVSFLSLCSTSCSLRGAASAAGRRRAGSTARRPHLTMFLCFSSFSRQISRSAELGTPCGTARLGSARPGGARRGPAPRSSPHLVVIVQPHPLQRHDLVRLPVLGLEHRPVGACGRAAESEAQC